jgi:hypothetical protein
MVVCSGLDYFSVLPGLPGVGSTFFSLLAGGKEIPQYSTWYRTIDGTLIQKNKHVYLFLNKLERLGCLKLPIDDLLDSFDACFTLMVDFFSAFSSNICSH